jgi:non-ribosomal peptide synthetase component F
MSCYHHLFEARAGTDLLAHVPAVEVGDDTVSYGELNRRANRLARHLISLGIGRESLVGLLVARSTDMIASLLAIAKAGGAYVRRSEIIARAGLSALVVDGGCRPLDLPPAIRLVDLVAHREAIGAAGDTNPGGSVSERNLAYILYTSGSTGEPKGIAMEHASLAKLIEWHGSARSDSLGQRTLQFCSISFDFSFHEIFSTLCYGGTLVLASEDERLDPRALARLIRERSIERVFLPVSALLQWAASVDETAFPDRLRHVFTTGEQLQITPALRSIFKRTGAKLHNHYGATEVQDAATLTLSGNPETWPEVVPVGYPLIGLAPEVVPGPENNGRPSIDADAISSP